MRRPEPVRKDKLDMLQQASEKFWKEVKKVLLHNGGSWNACTYKAVYHGAFLNRAGDKMVLFHNCCLYKIVNSTILGNMSCMVLS